MAKKTVYYKDALHDDFANTNINTQQVSADFPFVHRNPFWIFLEFILYRLIATPLVFLIGKIGFGLRIRNRKVLKKLRKTGFFYYGNHTNGMMDAYTPTLAAFPHKAHIIASPDAVSIPGIRQIVQMLGAIPLPSTLNGFRPFTEALALRIAQKHAVAIYPEAHIWPWYTGVRDFPDGSFAYPVNNKAPVIAAATTYRQRRVFKKFWPCMTVTLSEPFEPDLTLPPRAARKKLRDEVYTWLCAQVCTPENYAYYEYLPESERKEESI